MARIYHRKARKDYPDQKIKKGDMYYYTSIKTGPRSSRVIRQIDRIRPSQMTSSEFKGGWYATQENFPDSPSAEDITAAAETIRELGEQASENFENMPDGLQQGDTGQMLENRYSEAENISDQLDELSQAREDLEGPDEDDSDDVAEYESEIERIGAEAADLLGDMPE